MPRMPIIRQAEGVTVTRYTDGSPRTTLIKAEYGKQILLYGSSQARGLRWCLEEIERADDEDK